MKNQNTDHIPSSGFVRTSVNRKILLPFSVVMIFGLFTIFASAAFGQHENTQVEVKVTVFDVPAKRNPFEVGAFGTSKIFPSSTFKSDLLRYENDKRLKEIDKLLIAARDGKSSEEHIGTRIPNLTKTGTSQTSPIAFINVGLLVNIKPQLLLTGSGAVDVVSLNLKISDNEPDGKRVKKGKTPDVFKRELESNLQLKLDETAVVGGFASKNGKTLRYYSVSVTLVENKLN